ncbi:hypothetical protein WOLCODRAFT_164042 [Wolfiporia cocos MD-104 SS10]|uniref:Uncharacterized protein n=1 Tax=Wolfiporia cocos (strain MD-104) TaxID=742152 RepID=A0A2H3K340_WOLCO|nr:hypothetical protein WOLCODRAFT_164042 [Wolfiporia cocos MD-104 SS10]
MAKINNTEYFEFIRDVVGLKVKAVNRKNQEAHGSNYGTPPNQCTDQPLDGGQRGKWIEDKVRRIFPELVRLRALFDGTIQSEGQRELMMAVLRQVRVMETEYIKKFYSCKSRKNKPLEENGNISNAACGPRIDTSYIAQLEVQPRDYVPSEVLDLFDLASEGSGCDIGPIKSNSDSDEEDDAADKQTVKDEEADLSIVAEVLSGTTQDLSDAAQALRLRSQLVTVVNRPVEGDNEYQNEGRER